MHGMKRLLCRLVGHRWTWDGEPGAGDCKRRCLRCGKHRPAWLLDRAPVGVPAAVAWVHDERPAARPVRPTLVRKRGAAA